MVRFGLLCGDFLLPNPVPHLDNWKTVCMGYTAMTPQGRAGKRRWKGAGKPCRENGTPNIKWSKWPLDAVNDTKLHSPDTDYPMWTFWLHGTTCRSSSQCVQIEHIDSIAEMPVGRKTTASVKRMPYKQRCSGNWQLLSVAKFSYLSFRNLTKFVKFLIYAAFIL